MTLARAFIVQPTRERNFVACQHLLNMRADAFISERAGDLNQVLAADLLARMTKTLLVTFIGSLIPLLRIERRLARAQDFIKLSSACVLSDPALAVPRIWRTSRQ